MISFVCIQSLSPDPVLAFPKVSEHAIETTLALDSQHFLLPILKLTIFLLGINTFPAPLLEEGHADVQIQVVCRCGTFILLV